MPTCEVTELPEETCAHCRVILVGKKPPRHRYYTAQSAFPCDACGGTILRGDKFRGWGDGFKHQGCSPRSPR